MRQAMYCPSAAQFVSTSSFILSEFVMKQNIY